MSGTAQEAEKSGRKAQATDLARETPKILPVVLFILASIGATGGAYLFRPAPPPVPVVEAQPPLTAAAISAALEQTGHVALYVHFDSAKTEIKPESLPMITEIVTMMLDKPDLRLLVEGHTDSVGTPESNKSLSEGRARAVRDALIAGGIAEERLAFIGHGQDRPLADNAAESGRAKNRRVELVRW